MFGLLTCLGLLSLLCVGTLRKPAVAFAAVLCLYGLKQWGQSSTAFFAVERTSMNFAVAALVIIGLLRDWGSSDKERAISSTWVLGVVIYLYAFLTLTWNPNIATALEQWSLQIPYLLMIAIAAPLLLRSSEDVRCASEWTLVVGGTICALAFFFGEWGVRGLRVNGDFMRNETNPLAIASLGGTICVVAMVLVMAPMSWLKKGFCVAAALIGIAVILRSGSRGQLVAAGAGVLFGMPLAAKKRNIGAWLLISMMVVIVAQIGWWIWDQLGVNTARWSSERSGEDVEGRLMMASSLLSAAASEPITLLAGLGNSSSFFYVGFYPHIAALEVLAEEGLIGFSIYCSILALTFRNMLRLDAVMRARSDYPGNQAVAMLSALFIFEWLLTFKQGTLLSSVYVFAYASILGTLAKRIYREQSIAPSASEVQDTRLLLSNLMR